jgi:hypothetical protein
VCHNNADEIPPFGVTIYHSPLKSLPYMAISCALTPSRGSQLSHVIHHTGYRTQLHIPHGHISCFIPSLCTDHMWAGFAVGVCGKVPIGKSLNGSFAYGGGSGLYGLSHPRIDMVGDPDNSQPIPAKGMVVLTCSFGLLISYCLVSPVIASRPRRTTR